MKNSKSRMCVSIGVDSVPEALNLIVQERSHADVIEIRLDCLQDNQPQAFFDYNDIPLLFTNRPEWEGGFYRGSEDKRIDLLEQAVDGGAAYIDCELRAIEKSRRRLTDKTSKAATRLIFSWHDFNLTPPEEQLQETITAMQREGADIGKIVTTARDYRDVLRVLALQETAAELNFPLIAFCMGEAGVISRLATIKLGGYMTYCSPAGFRGTAPGQISSNYLRAILDLLQ